MAAPIPREPPVTKATLPVSFFVMFVFICFLFKCAGSGLPRLRSVELDQVQRGERSTRLRQPRARRKRAKVNAKESKSTNQRADLRLGLCIVAREEQHASSPLVFRIAAQGRCWQVVEGFHDSRTWR